MLFVSSNSTIENILFQRIHIQTSCVQSDIKSWVNGIPRSIANNDSEINCVVYSFQKLEMYKHLDSFETECKAVDHLIEFMQKESIGKIILISYPGAYYNAQNMFLKFKGLIEQKFINAKIPCAILHVQGIHDIQQHSNNLHELFYDDSEDKLLIPQKASCVVYSIQTANLVSMILKAKAESIVGKYDAFDTIYDLKTYVGLYSNVSSIQRVAPFYLYFKSFIGSYASPTMMELFLMTIVPMYKFRTEKEFGISLDAEKHGIYVSFNKRLIGNTSPYNTVLQALVSSR